MHLLALLLTLVAQRPDSLAAQVREYVAVDTSLLALTHVLVLDGTGGAPKTDQTVVIRAGRIAAVGSAASVQVPAGARVMDMTGSTVIPGIIGMHDHLFYTAAGGRAVQMGYTGSHLYLGSGVTTIRTTGSRAPYAEINLKDAIDHGLSPGPRIHLTAPYITGERGGGAMAILNSPEAARRFVRLLGGRGRDLDQSVYRHSARGAGRRHSGSAQTRHQGHGPPVLGEFPGSRRAGHRQSRARHAHRVRFHERQTGRRLPRQSHDADQRIGSEG